MFLPSGSPCSISLEKTPIPTMTDNDADENSLIMRIFKFVKNVSLLYFCEVFYFNILLHAKYYVISLIFCFDSLFVGGLQTKYKGVLRGLLIWRV